MKTLRRTLPILTILGGALVAVPASATFHEMQIEQVIGGCNGDVTAQAIQLRMRVAGQNLVHQARIRAWDAAGLNPVLIIDMTTDVANSSAGDRVLITSPAFQSWIAPVQTPDFTMTNLIPASYLAAGSLTFEQDTGTVYWRLSWGGAGYTGPVTMNIINDSNGNCGPPFGSALQSVDQNAVKFGGTAGALSTTNLADYALTTMPSTWTNNARLTESVKTTGAVGDPPHPIADLIQLSGSYPNPTRGVSLITFAMKVDGHASLAVYDAGGRFVRELMDADMAAGPHEARWDGLTAAGDRVPPGVYFVLLDALGESRSTKFVEVR